jgi:Ner family transcriptional regulator
MHGEPMKLDSQTKTLLRDPAKRWAWIRYQLTLRGIRLGEIALRHSVKPQTLTKVQHAPYPKMEKALADELELTPQELFPERYNEDGLPARLFPGRSPYHKAAANHC